MQNQRFEFIDGLRGIAALSVVLFHLNLAIQNHQPQAFPHFLEQLLFQGYLGIQIFFVLSGFVIAFSLRDSLIDKSIFLNFFLRRSIRLDPPYWTMVFITLILAGIASLTFKNGIDFPFNSLQILYNLLYLPDLMQVPFIIPVAWTLCLEFQFYLFFALLMLLTQKMRVPLFLWLALSFFSILQNTPFAILPLKPVTFIPHWYSFFLGCSTCWAMLGKMEKKILWLNYAIIAVCSFWTLTPHAIASLSTAFIIHGVAEKRALKTVLKHSFFQYLGRISYSLYLIHWTIGMKWVDLGYLILGPDNFYFLFIMGLFLTILAGDLFYRFIERPSHQFSRRFRLHSQKAFQES